MTLGNTAIVAGRSMAGLAAGAALAPHFDNVIIIDRDPDDADGDSRTGVGQGNHLHNLQRGGELAVEQLLPGSRDALVAAGAVEFRQGIETRFFDHGYLLPRRDVGFVNLSATRWLMENTVRQRLLQAPNVKIRGGTSLRELVFDAPDRVTGVVVETAAGASETLAADLVVDCTGRGSRIRTLLAAHGYGEVPELRIHMGLSYTSAFIDAPLDALDGDRALAVLPTPPLKRGVFASQVEGGRWQVSLTTRFEKDLPTTFDEMIAFAEDIETPDVVELLRKGKLVSPIRSYQKPHATWRRFDKLEKFPGGLLAMGDAVTSFNPIFGQGMSVAWQQAVALADILTSREESSTGLDNLAADFFPQAMTISREAWNASTLVDSAYDEVTGDTPAGAEQGLVFVAAVRSLLADDPDLHRDYIGVAQMTNPSALLMTPERIARVMAAAATMSAQ